MYSIVPSSGLQSGLMPVGKVFFGWFSGVLSWSVLGVWRRLRNRLILERMNNGIYSAVKYSSRLAGCFRTGIVPFLWLARMGQVPRRLYPFYRQAPLLVLRRSAAWKAAPQSIALRSSASLQLIFCMPFIMSQSGSFSRASHQIEIQGQRVAPDNLLVVSSIQEDFEEGLRGLFWSTAG